MAQPTFWVTPSIGNQAMPIASMLGLDRLGLKSEGCGRGQRSPGHPYQSPAQIMEIMDIMTAHGRLGTHTSQIRLSFQVEKSPAPHSNLVQL